LFRSNSLIFMIKSIKNCFFRIIMLRLFFLFVSIILSIWWDPTIYTLSIPKRSLAGSRVWQPCTQIHFFWAWPSNVLRESVTTYQSKSMACMGSTHYRKKMNTSHWTAKIYLTNIINLAAAFVTMVNYYLY
jgi:hypothetical protein